MAREKERMTGKTEAEKTRDRISLVASILIGLTLLTSGTGKIFSSQVVPAQVVDFISHIIPDIFITPTVVRFLYNVLVPHIMPWAEFILGACLLVGFLPRLMAVLTIPILSAFLGTNLWSIIQGGYATCADCFGIWEEYFGSLTPVQSLIYDLILFAFAILIIVFHPGRFISSRPWLANLGKIKRLDAAALQLKMRRIGNRLRDLWSKTTARLRLAVKEVRVNPRIALPVIICILGLATWGVIAALTSTRAPQSSTTTEEIPLVSDVSVSQTSETEVAISWVTDKPTTSSLKAYTADGLFTTTVTDNDLNTTHRVLLGGLSRDTTYYFKILFDDKQTSPTEYSFKTLATIPSRLTISDVRVSFVTETSATITWVTNRPTTSEVEYWMSGTSERNTVSDDQLATNHSMNLSALEANAIYYYQVKSTDANGKQATSPLSTMSAQIGKRAPDFTLTALDGRIISLSDYRGKLVLLDFWLWSCSACREKLVIIQNAYARIPKEKIAILSIHPGVKESVIQTYVEDAGLTVPILIDSQQEVINLYKAHAVPTAFFIDADGVVRLIDPEFNSAEELENIFNTMLMEPASQ